LIKKALLIIDMLNDFIRENGKLYDQEAHDFALKQMKDILDVEIR
jgi:nicotinamidase-related amidase